MTKLKHRLAWAILDGAVRVARVLGVDVEVYAHKHLREQVREAESLPPKQSLVQRSSLCEWVTTDERCHGTGIQPFEGNDLVEIECPGCVDCVYDWGEDFDDEMDEAEWQADNWEGWDGP